MKKETAKKILEIYNRIDEIKESMKFEQTNYDSAKFINSEYLMLRALNRLEASNRAIKRLKSIIDKLSINRLHINVKRMELEIELDQPNLSVNKEMQLKAQLQILNELL